MTTVRRYTNNDIPHIVEFAQQFAELHTPKVKVEPDVLKRSLVGNVPNSLFFCHVAVDDEELAGVFCARLLNYGYSINVLAVPMFYHSLTPTANAMLGEAFREWTRARRAPYILPFQLEEVH